jgi:hypothetical protein
MIKPISPEEAAKSADSVIPECIIAATNKLLVKNLNGKSAKILQDEILKEVCADKDNPAAFREQIFANKWLDIEETYRKVGWKVTYDKPAYCETYEAFFIFEKP